jgi:exportin-2 (importin alpha re-exporter)
MLHGTLWVARGNVPPLIRLLRAFLARSSADIVAANQLPAIKDIYRFLAEARVHDQYSWEVLEALFEFVPM